MIELEFPLNIKLDSPRPIFNADINGILFRCMLDTGADIPVFCKGIPIFEELTGKMDGVSRFKDIVVGGVGKTDERGLLWNMDTFVLSDFRNGITYKGMKVAVMDKPNIPCDMILSSSMFMKMKCTIDCFSKKHCLTIVADKDMYGVGYYDKKETIYIFSSSNKEIE